MAAGRSTQHGLHLIIEEAGQAEFVIELVIQGVFEGVGSSCRCRSTARNRGLVSMCL
ncbi:MAG: hypothetical protein Q7U25_02760 [Sulfuricella sp.]|nr:hypothetical protein [Sulfuricella sp.]